MAASKPVVRPGVYLTRWGREVEILATLPEPFQHQAVGVRVGTDEVDVWHGMNFFADGRESVMDLVVRVEDYEAQKARNDVLYA